MHINSVKRAVSMLFRLTAFQKEDLYDLMVTDRKVAERQNYGDTIFDILCFKLFLE